MKALKAPMRSIPGLKASNICKAWRNAARNVKMPQVLWLKFQQKVDQQISATPVQIQTKNFQRTHSMFCLQNPLSLQNEQRVPHVILENYTAFA